MGSVVIISIKNKKMKVIILAGGWGSRLGQMVESLPKPMVQIGGKPILWHIMKIYSYYGYNDFVIALGVKANVIKEYFYNFETLNNDFTINLSDSSIEYHNKHNEANWKVTLIDTGVNTLKGGRIKRVSKYLDDDINFVTYGDGVANVDIKKLLEFHKSHSGIITITGVHSTSRFGEINEKEGAITSFVEKPKTSDSYINGGFMVFDRELLSYLSEDENCDFEFGPLEQLAKEGKVFIYKHEGDWECMDHERDVTHLNELWKENKAFWKLTK